MKKKAKYKKQKKLTLKRNKIKQGRYNPDTTYI